MPKPKTGKEKQEELLLSYINIPYFRNNPAYIERWRAYFHRYRDPQILLLMYHKQISTFYHWIYLELSDHFLRKNQPEIAHFVLSEALRMNVYDSTRITKAIEKIPKFEKKYTRGDMLGLLNAKNIQALGRTWNCYKETHFYLDSPPEAVNYEMQYIQSYEKRHAQGQSWLVDGVPKSHEEDVPAVHTPNSQDELCVSDEGDKEFAALCDSPAPVEASADAGMDADQPVVTGVEEGQVPAEDQHVSVCGDDVTGGAAGEVLTSVIEVGEPSVIDKVDPSVIDKVDPSVIGKVDPSVIGKVDPSVIDKVNPSVIDKMDPSVIEKESLPEALAEDCITYSSSFICMHEEPEETAKRQKIEYDGIFELPFFDICDSFEPNAEVLLDRYVYLVQRVTDRGVELLRIARNADVTQTMIGKAFLLRKCSHMACKVLRDVFDFSICRNATGYFVLHEYNRICDLKDIMAGLSNHVRRFYLKRLLEKLIPLKEKGYLPADVLDFFVDQDFDLGLNCVEICEVDADRLDAAVVALKESFLGPDDVLAIDVHHISMLDAQLEAPAARKDILRHKTETLQNL